MSTILFRSCWVPFQNPPFSVCRQSFWPSPPPPPPPPPPPQKKIDLIFHFIQIVLGPILNFERGTPTDFYPECPPSTPHPHHHPPPTPTPPPTLNSSLGLAGGKHYQKFSIPIFRLVLQTFAIPCYFSLYFFYCYLFSLVSSDWVVIAVCDSISVQETS